VLGSVVERLRVREILKVLVVDDRVEFVAVVVEVAFVVVQQLRVDSEEVVGRGPYPVVSFAT
jgi:hypothetical protein